MILMAHPYLPFTTIHSYSIHIIHGTGGLKLLGLLQVSIFVGQHWATLVDH